MHCDFLTKERQNIKRKDFAIMSATVQKWMPWESAGCCSNQPEELPKNKTGGGEGKILKNGGGVEEIEILMERTEEKKKHLKKERMSYSDSGIAVEDRRMNIMSGMQQEVQGSSHVVNMLAHNKSSSRSPWKPSSGQRDLNRVDNVNNKENVDDPQEVELQVFPI